MYTNSLCYNYFCGMYVDKAGLLLLCWRQLQGVHHRNPGTWRGQWRLKVTSGDSQRPANYHASQCMQRKISRDLPSATQGRWQEIQSCHHQPIPATMSEYSQQAATHPEACQTRGPCRHNVFVHCVNFILTLFKCRLL